MLLHLVDATDEDIAGAYRTVRAELKAYGAGLEKKKEIVALSKCDAVDAKTLKERIAALKKAARKEPIVLSAVSRLGVKETLYALTGEITRGREKAAAPAVKKDKVWRP